MVDKTAPVLLEVTSIGSTSDKTPEYTFNSTEEGTITYSGDCVSSTVNAVMGNIIIIFNELVSGNYNNCKIMVTDPVGNISNTLNISEFTIKQEIIKTPIFRLYNTKTGVHLYTRGVADRDKILNKFNDFSFDDAGPAFYASLTDDGTTPIFRLYNTKTGVHLYTRGVTDRDKILNKFNDFSFDDAGPAFYARIN